MNLKVFYFFLCCLSLLGCKLSSSKEKNSSKTTERVWVDLVALVASYCALDVDGDAWCWGDNEHFLKIKGENGSLGTKESKKTLERPYKVEHPKKWKSLSAKNGQFICGIDETDELYCWGQNATWNFGTSYTGPFINGPEKKTLILHPHKMGEGKWSQVLLQINDAVALKSDGTLWSWGEGTGTQNLKEIATKLSGKFSLHHLKTRRLEQPELFVKKDDGKIYDIDNNLVDLGNQRLNWKDVAQGKENACGITTDKKLYCWGKNDFSHEAKKYNDILNVGIKDDIVNQAKEVDISYLEHPLEQVFNSSKGSFCVLDEKGEAYCWGVNIGIAQTGKSILGTLGTGNSSDVKIGRLKKVVGGHLWDKLLLIGDHAVQCGVTKEKEIYCWGHYDFRESGLKTSSSFYAKPTALKKRAKVY